MTAHFAMTPELAGLRGKGCVARSRESEGCSECSHKRQVLTSLNLERLLMNSWVSYRRTGLANKLSAQGLF